MANSKKEEQSNLTALSVLLNLELCGEEVFISR